VKEYLELGSTPVEETCAQVGEDNYINKAMQECRAYVKQLLRLHPGLDFKVKSFPHDFGSYYEVVLYYNSTDIESVNRAYEVEASLPQYWDDAAKEELSKYDSAKRTISN